MAKERNEAQKKAAELLQHIPIVECELMTSKPFYKDNRTKNVRVCKINDDLWVPTTELANGHPNSSRITKPGRKMKNSLKKVVKMFGGFK